MSVTAICQNCGLQRGPQDTGPCPRCGHQGRHLVAVINEVVGITDRIGTSISHNFVPGTRDRISMLAAIVTPFLGIFASFFPQPHSIIFGALIGLFSFTVSPILNRSWHRTRV